MWGTDDCISVARGSRIAIVSQNSKERDFVTIKTLTYKLKKDNLLQINSMAIKRNSSRQHPIWSTL